LLNQKKPSQIDLIRLQFWTQYGGQPYLEKLSLCQLDEGDSGFERLCMAQDVPHLHFHLISGG
jgi:hypothetical protein